MKSGIRCAVVVISISFGMAMRLGAGVNTWTSIGPWGGPIEAFATDPLHPATLYAGSRGVGMLKTTNGGSTWIRIGNGLEILPNSGYGYSSVTTIAVAPSDPDTIWIKHNGDAYKSTDAGLNWTRNRAIGATYQTTSPIAIDPAVASTVYVGTNVGIIKTSDGGANWQTVLADTATALAIDPQSPAVIYAAVNGGNLKMSTNAGASWQVIGSVNPNAGVTSIAVDPDDSTVVYFGGVGSVISGTTPSNVVVSRVVNGTRTLAPVGAFFLSGNTNTWFGFYENVNSLAVNRSTGSPSSSTGKRLIAGTNNGTFAPFSQTVDGQFFRFQNGYQDTRAVAVVPGAPPTLWMAGRSGGVASVGGVLRSSLSTPEGTTAIAANVGISDLSIKDIVRHPTNSLVLYAAGSKSGTRSDPGVYKSVDGGQTWTLNSNGLERPRTDRSNGETSQLPDAMSVRSLAIATSDPTRLYAGTENGIFTTADGGATWSDVTTATMINTYQTRPQINSVVVDPRNALVAFAASPGCRNQGFCGADDLGFYKTVNGGISWTKMSIDVTALYNPEPFNRHVRIAINPANPDVVYASYFGSLFRSNNGGSTWSTLANQGGACPNNPSVCGPFSVYSIFDILIDDQSPTMYFGTFNGVFKSNDGGATITPVATTFPAYRLRFHPSNHGVVYAWSGALKKSSNSGGTWSTVGAFDAPTLEGDGSARYGLEILPTSPVTILAGTDFFSIMSLQQAAPTVQSISPADGPVTGSTTVTILGTNFGPGTTVTFGGVAATNVSIVSSTSLTAVTPAHAAGVVDVVIGFADTTGTLAQGFTYGLSAPRNVVATASGTSSVSMTWSGSTLATGYEVWRSEGGAYALVTTTTAGVSKSYSDTTVAAGRSYLYKVRALSAGGPSSFSASDLATTVVFTDENLAAGLTVKAVHLTQLRSAVNLVRTAAGLAGGTFSDAAPTGIFIKAAHVVELRNAINQARTILSLPLVTPANGSLNGAPIRAIDWIEIRGAVK